MVIFLSLFGLTRAHKSRANLTFLGSKIFEFASCCDFFACKDGRQIVWTNLDARQFFADKSRFMAPPYICRPLYPHIGDILRILNYLYDYGHLQEYFSSIFSRQFSIKFCLGYDTVTRLTFYIAI